MKSITQTAMCFHQFREIKIIGCLEINQGDNSIRINKTKTKILEKKMNLSSITERAFDRAFHFEAESGPKSLTPGLNKVRS